jgi:hypothetical protein
MKPSPLSSGAPGLFDQPVEDPIGRLKKAS